MTTESTSLENRNSTRATLIAILSCNVGLGLSFGLQPPLIALVLSRAGASSFDIGAIAASTVVAVILFGPVYPRLIGLLGLKRSVILGLGFGCLTQLLMPGEHSIGYWMLLRFINGCALGWGWIAGEVWLNTISTPRSRSTVMGLYGTFLSAGTLCGPIMLEFTGTRGSVPFVAGAACLAVTLLPLAFLHNTRVGPQPHTAWRTFMRALMVSPEVMLAALVAGLVESADLALLPVLGIQSGVGERVALLFVTVFICGNMVMQLPIGFLADWVGRRTVLAVCAVVSGVGPLLLIPVLHVPGVLWPLLFVWGGTLYAFYSQGIALLGEVFPPADLALANTLFVMVYCLGGVIGPSVGGVAMDIEPRFGLAWVLSGSAVLLLAGLALGARHRAAVTARG